MMVMEKTERLFHGGSSYSEVETITVERAEEYLRFNTRNRSMKPRRVAEFRKRIRNGGWIPQLSNIIIFMVDDGPTILADGQNRLTAIIEEAVPVVSTVTYIDGTEEDFVSLMREIDSAPTRTLIDYIVIGDRDVDARRKRMAVGALDMIDNLLGGEISRWRSLNQKERLEYADSRPLELYELIDAAQLWRRENPYDLMFPYLGGYLVTFRASPVWARVYWEMICKKQGMGDFSPQTAIFNKINERSTKMRHSSITADPHGFLKLAHVYVKSWNAFCEGRKIKNLKPDTEFPAAKRHPKEPLSR